MSPVNLQTGDHKAAGKIGRVIGHQATLSGLEEITRWILSWGSKAKVLGPPELKKRVREELEAMMHTPS